MQFASKYAVFQILYIFVFLCLFGQFTDVFNKSDHSEVPFLSRSTPFMDDIVVSNEGVTKLLKDLNHSKALGSDELHPRVLKQL